MQSGGELEIATKFLRFYPLLFHRLSLEKVFANLDRFFRLFLMLALNVEGSYT